MNYAIKSTREIFADHLQSLLSHNLSVSVNQPLGTCTRFSAFLASTVRLFNVTYFYPINGLLTRILIIHLNDYICDKIVLNGFRPRLLANYIAKHTRSAQSITFERRHQYINLLRLPYVLVHAFCVLIANVLQNGKLVCM